MIEGREGPGVTCPSTRRRTTILELFNEAVISRSAASAACPGRWSSHRILLWRSRSGGDRDGLRHAEEGPTVVCRPPPSSRWTAVGHGSDSGAGVADSTPSRVVNIAEGGGAAGLSRWGPAVSVHAVSANAMSSIDICGLIFRCYCRALTCRCPAHLCR